MVEILSLYHFIPAAQKKLFNIKLKRQTIKRGDFLLMDEEVQERLYLVKRGVLIFYFDTDKGFEILDFAYQNRFCADLDSFTNQSPSDYCIQCVVDGEVEYIHLADLESILAESPDIERAYRLLTERILVSLLKKQLNQRIMSIQQRFALLMEKQPELFKLVPHKYIASYINIDPTNFSKLYNQFCKNGGLYFE